MRKSTKEIRIGSKYIGGTHPILVQSMTNTKTQDVASTIAQIKQLEEAGCDVIRVAVPDFEAAKALQEIKKGIAIPLVADIHFDYRLAIESIKMGADKIRINPGNIGDFNRLMQVIKTAKEYEVPIRVGVNSGSLEKDILEKHGSPTSDALVESTLRQIELFEGMDFDRLVISIKSSDVVQTIESYVKISEKVRYPMHLGITEAGTAFAGTIKSSVGIGTLLYMGIGDTIRVSLTGDPVIEIETANEILKSLKLKQAGANVIACPTCGRTNVDLVGIAESVERELKKLKLKKPLTIAVMGCAVNGPGEAREADIGIAGGIDEFLLFVKGQVIRKISEDKILEELIKEIKAITEE